MHEDSERKFVSNQTKPVSYSTCRILNFAFQLFGAVPSDVSEGGAGQNEHVVPRVAAEVHQVGVSIASLDGSLRSVPGSLSGRYLFWCFDLIVQNGCHESLNRQKRLWPVMLQEESHSCSMQCSITGASVNIARLCDLCCALKPFVLLFSGQNT